DITHPSDCCLIGGYPTQGAARGVALSGPYAWVADDRAGLQVIDVSDPTHCVRVGGVQSGRAYRVAVSENYAYLAKGPGGVEVIDAKDPLNCVRVGAYITAGYARK